MRNNLSWWRLSRKKKRRLLSKNENTASGGKQWRVQRRTWLTQVQMRREHNMPRRWRSTRPNKYAVASKDGWVKMWRNKKWSGR